MSHLFLSLFAYTYSFFVNLLKRESNKQQTLPLHILRGKEIKFKMRFEKKKNVIG